MKNEADIEAEIQAKACLARMNGPRRRVRLIALSASLFTFDGRTIIK